MNSKDLTRLQALADGFRGSRGTLSLAARDYELCGGKKAFKDAKPNATGRAYTVAAPEFVKAIDKAAKADRLKKPKSPPRQKPDEPPPEK